MERTTRISGIARASRLSRIGRAPRLLAAAGVAMIALSACGPLRLGAAATYGNARITQAKLTDEVRDLSTAYQAYRSKVPFQYTEADMPRKVLTWLLTFATFNQIAAEQKVQVTPEQVQQEGARLRAGVSQNGLTLDQAAAGVGLPPDLLPAYEAFAVQETALLGNPTTAQDQAAARAKLGQQVCHAAKSLSISVNPQYGAFQYQTLQVMPAASTLSAPPGGNTLPLPTAPRFKPAC